MGLNGLSGPARSVLAAFPSPSITVPVAWLVRPDLAWADPRGGVAMCGQKLEAHAHGVMHVSTLHGVGTSMIPVVRRQ
jgi:hypothetical protein